MAAQFLTPFSGRRPLSRAQRREDTDPLLAFRRDMSRLFDDFFGGFGMPSLAVAPTASTAAIITPRIDVSETDQEIRVAVELPGVDEANLDVTLDDDTLIVRGQQQATREEEDRDYHLKELSQGSFMRAIQLPFSPDPNQVRAVIRSGILNITIPKPKQVQEKTRRIEVQRDQGAASGATAGSGMKETAERAAAGDKPSAAGGSSATKQQSPEQSAAKDGGSKA